MKRFVTLLLGLLLLGCVPLGLFQAEPTPKPTRTSRPTATYVPPTEMATPWIITRVVTVEVTRLATRLVVPRSPTNTAIPSATVLPSTYMNFRADRQYLSKGECTTLRWDVEGVKEIYLNGDGRVGHGFQEVCPNQTTTHNLRVVQQNGFTDLRVTITILP